MNKILLSLLFLVIPTIGFADVTLFAPTPIVVAEKMLEVAKINKDTVVYDLGSGDGRLVIMASLIYDCKAVGIEMNKKWADLSKRNVVRNRVEDKVEIWQDDILTAELDKADVLFVYLMPDLLEKLKPVFGELEKGVLVVSHDKPIPGVVCDKKVEVKSEGVSHFVFMYTLPLKKEECEGGT